MRRFYKAQPTTDAEFRDRISSCVFPTGISYADRAREEHGDYKKLAHLFFSDLRLDFAADCPDTLREWIAADAAGIQSRRGEQLEVSTCGQYVVLGSALA